MVARIWSYRWVVLLTYGLVAFLVACGTSAPEPVQENTEQVSDEPESEPESNTPEPVQAPTEQEPSDQEAEERVFRYNFPFDYGGARLDIGKTYSILDPNLFLGLTRYNPDNEVIPGAASSWDVSDDGLTYTFHLFTDLQWSDGTPLTAHDFEFGWKRALDPATQSVRAYQLHLIEGAEAYNTGSGSRDDVGVRAIDDYTLEVTLANRAPFFPGYAAGNNVYYASPRHVIENVGDDWIQLDNLVYSGPFMITEYVENSLIVMEPNPLWSGELPKVDRVEYHVVPDASVVLAKYEAGELDFAHGLPLGEIERILNDPQLSEEFVGLPDFRTMPLWFNVTLPPLDSVLVRQALLHATDREALSTGPFRGALPPAYSMRPTQMVGGDLDYLRGAFDPDRARELLAEAGYPDGEGFPEITIQTRNEQDVIISSEFLQSQWSSILNIPVQIEIMEPRALLDMSTQGLAEIWHSANFALSNDLYDLYNVMQSHAHSNAHWEDEHFDMLLDEAASEQDPEVRQELYDQAENYLVIENAVAIPLWQTDVLSLIKPHVSGLREDQRSIWLHTWEYIEADPSQ